MQDIDFAKVGNGKPKEVEIIEGALIIKVIDSKTILDTYLPKAEVIRNQAFAIKIIDAQTREEASKTGVMIKNGVKDVNLAVQNAIKEAKQYVTETVSIGKKIVVVLEQGKSYLASELLKDKQRQDLERAKQEKAIKIADEARQKTLEAEAKRLNIKPPEPIAEPILPKKTKDETQTRTDAGVSFAKGKWTYELLDITQVPREYLLPKENGPLINQKIKQGLRDQVDKTGKVLKVGIPGIRIYFREEIAFR
ncbi:MAG: hypothetical protein E3J56_13185 [Candidatus Aminicenantes bacterium]|nr:MAG: hypothetical protein E3J56_13185 [Candidatus Aminicenantes bacterium]